MARKLEIKKANNKFLKTIEDICYEQNDKNFKEAPITPNQSNAIQEYAGFLAVITESSYSDVAYGLLKQFYFYNLSVSDYRFEPSSIKTGERKLLSHDIRMAKKHLKAIKESSSQEQIEQVKQNIKELGHRLNFNPDVKEEKSEFKPYEIFDGVNTSYSMYKKYETINEEDYHSKNIPDKFGKADIELWLKNIVKKYDIKGVSNDIRKLLYESDW